MRPLALLPALAIIGLALPAFADDASDGPTKLSPLQIGEIFCIAVVGNDMAPVESILTPALKKAIANADALNAAWARKHPGDKPPLGDGLPWQGHPDYTSDCTAGQPNATGAAAKVAISYKFAADASADYADALVLKTVPDAQAGDTVWRIDDVMFADGTGMRQAMIDAFRP